jgi:hypothetical protein
VDEGYPVLEKTSTRRSMNAHVSDSVVSHPFASLARGGDAVRGDSSFPLARPRSTMEIEDETYEGSWERVEGVCCGRKTYETIY